MELYQSWREAAASWGSIYFGSIFLIAIAYALWPSNKKGFDEAALIPLREDEKNGQ